MELKELLKKAYDLDGSDIFIVPGSRVTVKVKGDMIGLTDDIVKPAGTEQLVREAYELARRDIAKLGEEGDDDFSFAIPTLSRFRCNAYYQRGTMAATLRV
ncbi:MAG: type IV pili twitching motility protein PilT, partial [bacterium]